jgi:hypothetical protein
MNTLSSTISLAGGFHNLFNNFYMLLALYAQHVAAPETINRVALIKVLQFT